MRPAMTALALLCATTAHAWDNTDTVIEGAFGALLVVDYAQTMRIAKACPHGHIAESNLILGRCPSAARVTAYFITTALAHVAVAAALPKEHRRTFQALTFGLEIGAVNSNVALGVGFGF